MTAHSILITGAGGFVGSHLAEGFRDLGYGVCALDAAFDPTTRRRLQGIELHEATLDTPALDRCAASQVVVHAAAFTSAPEELGLTTAAHMQANLDSMLMTLDWAIRVKARSFVFVSSSGVFSADDASDLLLESTPATGTGAYALAKRAGELIALGSAAPDLAVLVVRLGYLYGPFEAPRASRRNVSLIRRWLDEALANEALTVETPELRRDWTYVRDLARALDALLTGGASGLHHMGSGAVETDLDVARAVAEVAGTTIHVTGQQLVSLTKAPMGRGRAGPLDSVQWTPLASGIAETLAMGVSA